MHQTSPHGPPDPALRLAAIVESSDDAIISKNLVGFITSWNAGAERIFGYSANEALGRHITMLIPEERRHEEDHILGRIRAGERLDHFETVRRRKDGQLIEVSLTVSPIKDHSGRVIGASKIARDISGRKAAAATIERLKDRYESLNSIAKTLSSDLDLERVVDMTIEIATRLTGAKFGAFFYNVIDAKGESYLLYALSGAPREAFSHIGMPRNTAVFNHTFTGQGPLRSDDIRKDPRYGKNAPHNGMPGGHLPVVSYLAVPVMGRNGAVIGGLFFAHDEPGKFDEEAEAIATGIAAHAAIAVDNAQLHRAAAEEIKRRTAAEETKELLLHEIKHRVKNMLSTIDAMASQTLRDVPPAVAEAFSARVRALAGAHDLLTDHDWREIDVVDIAHKSLAPFRMPDGARLAITGPHVTVDANKSLLLALAFHELATNALKYGAWSTDAGQVRLAWTQTADGWLDLTWTESGGPPVSPPTRKGFGSTLIHRALGRGGGEATLEFPPSGAVCRIRMQPQGA